MESTNILIILSYSYLPYATMGSGSLQAMTIIESKFKDNMTKDEDTTTA